MGGDHAPEAVLEGAREARRRWNLPITLVGDQAKLGAADDFDIVHTSEVIEMCDDPGPAVRNKKDSSLVVAAELVRDGKASAMVSAGNTGATMAAALLRFGRIARVARPAIATTIPVPGHTPTVLADTGANADCQPAWLVQFAQMASAYATGRFGIARPRVAILSIGEEASKGNQFVKETHALLAATPGIDFIGNVEGRDFIRPVADVVVTDGFTGNVVLKCLEGGVGYLADRLVSEFRASLTGKIAGLLMKPKLKGLMRELDPTTYGGAMLLGVNGVCIISHGSSTPNAIANAIGVGRDMVEAKMVERMQQVVQSAANAETMSAPA